MTISIRKFLLINLLLTMTIVISLTAIGNYYLDKQDIDDHLDVLLSQAGFSFTAIASHDIQNQNWAKLQARLNAVPADERQHFQHQDWKKIQARLTDTSGQAQKYFQESSESKTRSAGKYRFQIWSPDNQLLLRSENAPTVMLSDGKQGFNDYYYEDIHYRVFSNIDPETKLTFVVAESYTERDRLSHHILIDDLYILLLTYPLAGLLIWVVIGRGLSSLERITAALRRRDPLYLKPMSTETVPIEVKPLIVELNGLLKRLHEAIEREKRFASDAAHELRTPLAAIRTQAQVALMVSSSPEQQVILQNVILGVDRSTHIVNQLLSMSRLTPENQQIKDAELCHLTLIIQDVISQLRPLADSKNIQLIFQESDDKDVIIMSNSAALQIMVRNLIDNAIRYTPKDGVVNIALQVDRENIVFTVADNGPGVPEEFRERIFERFFRMLGNEAPGSGLGLSIVKQIVNLNQARIVVDYTNLEEKTGLKIQIQFPKK
jgi:two-component system sensor histidine kinase QseC